MTSIEFDDYSFHELTGILELSNLPSIQEITIGDHSFVHAEKVLASGLDKLNRMSIGEGSLTSLTEYE